jgi:signal transduction histidine kinase
LNRFVNTDLVPHSVCWASDPQLIWTMVVTNLITFLSYLAICCTLLYLVRRTGRLIVREWAYFVVGFALFIVACGSTHLMEVITTWNPIFWVDAVTNVVTALLSAYVALMLIGRIQSIAFAIDDYAHRVASTEDEKLKMQQSLLDARKLEDWSRMSATVSHEIKSPLQAIQNLQYLIANSEGVSSSVAELARVAGEEAQRVLAIADTALSFIRQATNPEIVDLCAAVGSVRLLLAPIIREKSIELRMEHSGDCKVVAFSGEARQVLVNVIRNACEAVNDNRTIITVEISGNDAGVQVLVSDQGPGIEPELMPHLFEFGATTKGDRGNGMGLWTVKHIVSKHGGDVKVQSSRNQGTQVRLWWPRDFRVI